MEKLSEITAGNDPVAFFKTWYYENESAGGLYPDAFTLATSSREGFVSARTVLLKDFGTDGFVFFTNTKSRKGLQIAENNRVAMLFYWPHSGRQIRIEGKAKKVTPEESDKYYSSRPRESRIGAWASNQSKVIADRKSLDDRFADFSEKFKNEENIPRPEYWGGYRIHPDWFEFWKEGDHRLHDRIVFRRTGSRWIRERLSP
jgi:pyridoxamine 5'-phosphate oxidase